MIPDNVLHARIEELLIKYPPFSLMRAENLRLILDRIRVRYVDKGDVIYRQGDTTPEYFYMIRRGAVRLERSEGATNILLDIYDEGDVFGIRPVIADQPYLSTSIAHEDRKSTRLNSSHVAISYAVFCLKKKTSIKHGTM